MSEGHPILGTSIYLMIHRLKFQLPALIPTPTTPSYLLPQSCIPPPSTGLFPESASIAIFWGGREFSIQDFDPRVQPLFGMQPNYMGDLSPEINARCGGKSYSYFSGNAIFLKALNNKSNKQQKQSNTKAIQKQYESNTKAIQFQTKPPSKP